MDVNVIMLGYMPLLYPDSSMIISSIEDVEKMLSTYQQPNIYGCAWAKNDSEAMLLFVTNGLSKKLYDHILWYSENDPTNWFTISYKLKGKGYDIGLFPNVVNNCNRYKKNYKIMYGKELSAKDIKVIFQPLTTFSPNNTAFSQIDIKDGDIIKFGFIDSSKISDGLKSDDFNDNMFNVKVNLKLNSYFDSHFDKNNN